MSNYVQGRVWAMDLAAELQHVLIALADHAHDDGTSVKPGVPYLSWKCNKSERAIIYSLRRLEALGVILPEGQTPNGITAYRIDVDAIPAKKPFQRNPNGRPRVAQEPIKTVQDLHPVEKPGAITGKNPVQPAVKPGAMGGQSSIRETDVNQVRETDTMREPLVPPAKSSRDKPARILISPEQREKLLRDYALKLGGTQNVMEMIEEALSHLARMKWTNEYLYVRNWVRGEADKYARTHPGQGRGNLHEGNAISGRDHRGGGREAVPGHSGAERQDAQGATERPMAKYNDGTGILRARRAERERLRLEAANGEGAGELPGGERGAHPDSGGPGAGPSGEVRPES